MASVTSMVLIVLHMNQSLVTFAYDNYANSLSQHAIILKYILTSILNVQLE